MDVRFPRYAPVLLVLVAASGAFGCGGGAAGPTSPQAPVPVESSVTVEPHVLRPEFLSIGSCTRRSPFGLRLRVIVSGKRNLFLRSMRFRLTDPFETSTFPEVIPTPSGSEAALPPAPFSGAASLPPSAIPIPGAAPFSGAFVPVNTAHSLPFFLRFGCGVIPEGTLSIWTDLDHGGGPSMTSHLRVPVAGR